MNYDILLLILPWLFPFFLMFRSITDKQTDLFKNNNNENKVK